MRSGELAERTGISTSAMSRHLQLLRRHGLVEERHDLEDARIRLYSLKEQPLHELSEWINETRQVWDDQFQDFRNHVESGAQ